MHIQSVCVYQCVYIWRIYARMNGMPVRLADCDHFFHMNAPVPREQHNQKRLLNGMNISEYMPYTLNQYIQIEMGIYKSSLTWMFIGLLHFHNAHALVSLSATETYSRLCSAPVFYQPNNTHSPTEVCRCVCVFHFTCSAHS